MGTGNYVHMQLAPGLFSKAKLLEYEHMFENVP
jgi:hypothetical protein